MQMIGKKLRGRYELITRVGGGGMATVYKARDSLLNRYVAIKVLNESLSNDSEFLRRFSREAQAAASLSHPNIVNVYDVGYDGYTHYIVMELVEGPTLKQYVRAQAPLSVEESTAIVVQICEGLAHAHENQIVHRDIKPHNILLGSRGRVKVTDFGIARAASSVTITQTGSVMGSVHYFSPEQARGGSIDLKSDLYSLGVVLYEMLTGRLPFMGDAAISIALKHLQEPVSDPREYNPEIPEEMVAILFHALEKDPELRFDSAQTFRRALLRVVPVDRHQDFHWQDFKVPEPVGPDKHKNTSENYLTDSHLSLPSGTFARNSTNHSRLDTLSEDTNTANSTMDETILQRTAAWLGSVGPQRMSLWKRVLFAILTILIILVLSVWGFVALWNMFQGRNDTNSQESSISEEDDSVFKVPQFATPAEAMRFAKEKGLPSPIVQRVYHAGTTAGYIWKQDPVPGKVASRTTPIRLYIGTDDDPNAVQNYIGKWESRIEGLPFIEKRYCDAGGKVQKGRVVGQWPEPGLPFASNTTVQVFIHVPGYKERCDASLSTPTPTTPFSPT